MVGSLDSHYSQIIKGLLDETDLSLQCYIRVLGVIDASLQTLPRKRKTPAKRSLPNLALSVILYGERDLSDDIGEFLSDWGESLQLPLNCDRNVEYRNPQSLNRDDVECPMTFDIRTVTHAESSTILPTKDPSSVLEANNSTLEAETPGALKPRSQLYRYVKQSFL